ncbi:unnamed protein product [Amoebophrya sp. A25]|nr:unnamed protein product [Amoebophrya sp. A25]|eukprot:GSA25T00012121001.1
MMATSACEDTCLPSADANGAREQQAAPEESWADFFRRLDEEDAAAAASTVEQKASTTTSASSSTNSTECERVDAVMAEFTRESTPSCSSTGPSPRLSSSATDDGEGNTGASFSSRKRMNEQDQHQDEGGSCKAAKDAPNMKKKKAAPVHPYWDGIPADEQGLYKPKFEGEACGVGAICDFQKRASREIMEQGKEMLIRMTHRGATTRPMDGDGAGILCSIPDRFFREMTYKEFTLPPAGEYGVGIIFLPRLPEKRHDCKALIQRVAQKLGLMVLGYRQVPTDSSHLGQYAAFTEPYMSQIFVKLDDDYFERNQYTLDTASVYSVSHTASRGPGGAGGGSHTFTASYGGDGGKAARRGIDEIIFEADNFAESATSETGVEPALQPTASLKRTPSPNPSPSVVFGRDHDQEGEGDAAIPSSAGISPKSVSGAGPARSLPRQISANRPRGLSTTSAGNSGYTAKESAERQKTLELKLFLLRRLVSLRGKELYFCSLSNSIIVYKGQLVPEQLFRFFQDLEDPRFVCHLLVVHSRFSTNSFPSWSRAHPHRCLAHNGEINTFQGNVNWIRAREAAMESFGSPVLSKIGFSARHLFPVNEDVGSDSGFLDNVVELLNHCSDRDLVEVMLMLIPEAWQNDSSQSASRRAFWEYQACAMEPWDGPALVIFTDGSQLGATLDRNGLRPGRYYITKDDRLILASEVGVVDVDPNMVKSKGRLQPGKILLVDFDEKRVMPDDELKEKYAAKYRYEDWLRSTPHVKDFFGVLDQHGTPLPPGGTAAVGATGSTVVNQNAQAPVSTASDARTLEMLLTSAADLDDLEPTSPGRKVNFFMGQRRSSRSFDQLAASYEPQAAERSWKGIEIPYLTLFGFSHEKVEMILAPMALTGSEPLGSMGNDAPLACLSRLPRSPFDYFYQLFAQATNPAIDPIREANVMTLECPIGSEGNLLKVGPDSVVNRCFLDEPVLDTKRFRVLQQLPCFEASCVLDLTYSNTLDVGRQQWNQKAFENDTVLETRLDQLCNEAEAAIKIDGTTLLILSHRRTSPETIPISSLLAVGTLHQYLVERKLRTEVTILVEGGDCFEIHHFALLLGYGADAVYPYMAYLALQRCRRAKYTQDVALQTKIEQYRKSVHQGLLKVMSKCGISCLQSYKGAQLFQGVGISKKVVDKCFSGTDVALYGVGFDIFHFDAVRLHQFAFQQMRLPPLVDEETRELPDWGEYHFRSVDQQNEFHMNSPDVIAKLQQAAKQNSTKAFRLYEEYQDKISEQSEVRGQLEFVPHDDGPLDMSQVEPASEIVKRFVTGAVSLGAISEEAHKALAIAMNRVGSKSNTGEGGEESERFKPLGAGTVKAGAAEWELRADDSFRSSIKQVASGRFGVTAEYLVNADELQIKLAQGAKPGEGGELPGYKVIGRIADVRRSTPGVGLISPPPHHDMYSIEDVAQLISDLKHVNPEARISVKLVSRVGVGIIASGIVKGKANHVTISGGNGGTGAAKWTSIKRTGLPWEIGLAETHQTLNLNGIRHQVKLQTDGQIRTSRDCIVAFLLGSDEVAMTTTPLITLGCIMMRKCHLNTCPVGVATQDPELRAKFDGHPEHLINYLFLVANEIRQHMAALRVATVKELIGRADLLRPRASNLMNRKTAHLDFDALLTPAWTLESMVMPDAGGCAPDHPASVSVPSAGAAMNERSITPYPADHRGVRRAPGNYMCCGGSATADALDHFLVSEIRVLKESSPGYVGSITDFSRTIRSVRIPNVRITNRDRTVGAMLSHMLVKFQERNSEGKTLAKDTIRVQFHGNAGQSFAAFLVAGVTFELEGDANDGTAKGLSGGRVIIYPPATSALVPHRNILIGNATLYGATGGQAFFSGVAAERFAIRNSGAMAVVEGCGDHGCEYMTRGLVLVLGPVGKNFAAGMSGGIAFALDLHLDNVNSQTVFVEPVNEDDCRTIKELLEEHVDLTRSAVGQELLGLAAGVGGSRVFAQRFSRIFPKEYKKVLKEAIVEHTKVGSKMAGRILDEFNRMRNPLPERRTDLFTSAFLLPLKSSRGLTKEGMRRNLAHHVGMPIGGPLQEVGGVGLVRHPTLAGLGLGTVTEQFFASAEVNELANDEMTQFRQGYALWRKYYWMTGGVNPITKELRSAAGGIADSDSPVALEEAAVAADRSKRSSAGGGSANFLSGSFGPLQRVYMPKKERDELLNNPRWTKIMQRRQKIMTAAASQAPLPLVSGSSTAQLSTLSGSSGGENSPVNVDIAGIGGRRVYGQRACKDSLDATATTDTGGGTNTVMSTSDSSATEDQNSGELPVQKSMPQLAFVTGDQEAVVAAAAVQQAKREELFDGAGVSAATPSTSATQFTTALALVDKDKKTYLQKISDVEDILAGAHLRHTAVSLPTKRKGFHLYQRKTAGYRDAKERLLDYEEIYAGAGKTTTTRKANLVRTQASRCMNCGTPTCQFPNQGGGGCPLANRIPVWNSLVHEDDWKRALERLLDTNNFPEFTGTTCPAPCEEACVLGINEGPVTIKSIENAIIEKGFQMGWVTPKPPYYRTKKKVAIVGSGPCGLAAAQQLNRAGHSVTVLEREDQFGGLLFYGIPNMKLEKRKVARRIDLMRQEGISFVANVNVGYSVNYDLPALSSNFDAVLFSTGAAAARRLDAKLPGHDLGNIVQAMDFLTDAQRFEVYQNGVSTHGGAGAPSQAALVAAQAQYGVTAAPRGGGYGVNSSGATGGVVGNVTAPPTREYDCSDKDVVVIGGGDTSVDVIATALRQGAKSVTQFSRRPKASETRPTHTPWPSWADTFRTDYAHNEYISATGSDPRTYCIRTRAFLSEYPPGAKTVANTTNGGSPGTIVKAVQAIEEILDADGNRTGAEKEVIYKADYVFLAMGFTGAEKIPSSGGAVGLRSNALFHDVDDGMGLGATARNFDQDAAASKGLPESKCIAGTADQGGKNKAGPNAAGVVATVADTKNSAGGTGVGGTSVVEQDGYFLGGNIFYAGDCRRGASLVVTAIAEGRDVANRIDEYLLAKDTFYRSGLAAMKNAGQDASFLFNRGLSALPRCIPLAQNPALHTRNDVLETADPGYGRKKKKRTREVTESFERGFLLSEEGGADPGATKAMPPAPPMEHHSAALEQVVEEPDQEDAEKGRSAIKSGAKVAKKATTAKPEGESTSSTTKPAQRVVGEIPLGMSRATSSRFMSEDDAVASAEAAPPQKRGRGHGKNRKRRSTGQPSTPTSGNSSSGDEDSDHSASRSRARSSRSDRRWHKRPDRKGNVASASIKRASNDDVQLKEKVLLAGVSLSVLTNIALVGVLAAFVLCKK